MRLFDLKHKWAVITGASRGIGRSIALGLSEAGANIILCSTNENLLQNVAQEIQNKGGTAKVYVLDIRNSKMIDNFYQKIDKDCINIDILVNNAGVIQREHAEKFNEEDWNKILDINLKGTFLMSQEAGIRMLKRGKGKIINIASILGFLGGKNVSSYVVSKGGICSMTKALASEWGGVVNVNAIAPGYIETDMTLPLKQDSLRYNEILGRIPAKRWGKVDDLKGAAIFLASNASNYVNGHTLVVDGGYLIY